MIHQVILETKILDLASAILISYSFHRCISNVEVKFGNKMGEDNNLLWGVEYNKDPWSTLSHVQSLQNHIHP